MKIFKWETPPLVIGKQPYETVKWYYGLVYYELTTNITYFAIIPFNSIWQFGRAIKHALRHGPHRFFHKGDAFHAGVMSERNRWMKANDETVQWWRRG